MAQSKLQPDDGRQLTRSIAQLYDAFGDRGEGPLTSVDASPYVPAVAVERLCGARRRELGADDLDILLYKAVTTVGTVEDFKFFLPRILELLADATRRAAALDPAERRELERQNDLLPLDERPIRWELYPPWEELSHKLTTASWRSWPPGQRDAIETVLRDVLLDGIRNFCNVDDAAVEYGWVLKAAASLGVDLAPVTARLAPWLADCDTVEWFSHSVFLALGSVDTAAVRSIVRWVSDPTILARLRECSQPDDGGNPDMVPTFTDEIEAAVRLGLAQ